MKPAVSDLIESDDFLGNLGRLYAREFMAKQEVLPPAPDDVEAMICERVGTFRLVLLLAGADRDVALSGCYVMYRALVDETERLASMMGQDAGHA